MRMRWQYDPQGQETLPDQATGYRHRYEGFRNLLELNSELLELLADLQVDLRNVRPGEGLVRDPLLRLLDVERPDRWAVL
jgi:hypothetical protein